MNTRPSALKKSLLLALVLLLLTAMQPAFSQDTIDAGERASLIQLIESNLTYKYIFPDVGAEMVALLESRLKDGSYDNLTDPTEFAQTLTNDLFSISHDKHLRVDYLSPIAMQDALNQVAPDNYGFLRVETLPGNIGYLDFRVFAPLSREAQNTAAGAMAFLSNTDAIIIDLRENSGGGFEMNAFLASYLFSSKPIHLFDVFDRTSSRTTVYSTLKDIPLPSARKPNTPLFILTSPRTLSQAENFSYTLQALKRATIVGEVTWGGAHGIGYFPLLDDFYIALPYLGLTNTVTGTDWEGVGVIPDVLTTADAAYDTAYNLALGAVGKSK